MCRGASSLPILQAVPRIKEKEKNVKLIDITSGCASSPSPSRSSGFAEPFPIPSNRFSMNVSGWMGASSSSGSY